MPTRFSPKLSNRFSKITPQNPRPRRRDSINRATGQAIEMLEGRVLLSVVNNITDPLTGAGVDFTKWTATGRGLENNAFTSYDAPSEDANGLVLGGTVNSQYWYGNSLETVDQLSSQTSGTVSVDRVALSGSGSAYRSSLWILQPGGKYVHFSQNVGETGWSYNANFTGSTIATGSGTAIGQFNNTAGQNEHVMKLVYTPGTGTNADVGIYLDGNLGATVHFTAWDHTVPFEAILTGQGRAAGDSVTATFKNFSAVSDPIPTDPPLAPTNLTATAAADGLAVNLSWLDNSNNEINYRLERSTDGTNFTEVATIPAVAGSGTTGSYTDIAPAAGTKFYYRVRAFNTANSGSFSDYTNIANVTTAPSIATLTDPLTGAAVDTTKWNVTNRGLENNGPAGYSAAEDATGLTLSGTATGQYWYGASLESKDVFRSEYQTTISVDRTALTGTGSAWRSSLWILQPTAGGQYLHFSQDVNESGWQYNQTTNGVGTNITAFDPLDADPGDHIMKLVYTPLGGTNAKVDIYLDNTLGTTVNYTNWDNTIPFEVILTGQARAATDTVSAKFTNFSAVATVPVSVPPTNLIAQHGTTGVNLSFTDNATGELYYSIERSTDGTNFTNIANINGADGTGTTINYTDTSAGSGTYFYRVREFSYATPNLSAPSNIAAVTVPPPTVSAPIITSLVDPLTEDTLDTTKWTETKRGLENTGDAGYSSFITPSGLFFNGTATNQYWYGDSIESNGQFSSGMQTTVQVEREFLSGTGAAGGTGNWRSSLWILQDNGQFLHFAQDFGETGWEYNQTAGNVGTAIDAFNTAAPDPGTDHIMKLVYTPLGGTNATVDMYLDGVLGATATFTNWDNSVPFRVILSGMARATGDSVETAFDNFSAAVTGPAPIVISGTDNADNFYIKKDADGLNADVWINSPTPGAGSPTTQFLLTQLSTVELDGLGGNDKLTVDYSNGSPIPLTGLKYAGGAGTDTLKVVGTDGNDAFGVGSGGLNHAGGGTLTTGNDVEALAVSQGNYAVDAQAITSGSFTSLDVGIGGTVRVIYPDAPPGDPNTAILVATIKSLLASGRNGGTWNGPGISSADAGTHAGTALGYSNANDVFTIKFTTAGDTNLDGTTSFADLVAVAQNYGKNDSTVDWAHGDVTYDGQVSFADLVAVAQTYGKSAPTAAPVPAAIPASAPVAAAAPAPAAVVATPPVVSVSTPPKVTTSTPPVKPVTKPVVTAKPPVVTTTNTTTSQASGTTGKPAPVTTPFAAKTTLTTQGRLEVSNADVLGKKPSSTTSLFL